MGTSPTEPFRFSLKLFIFNIQKTSIKMPKGAGLTKPMKLSAELGDIVGKKEASRAECIKQLWAYIKKNNLQDPENKQFFVPDKKMARVFGNDRIRDFGAIFNATSSTMFSDTKVPHPSLPLKLFWRAT